MKLKLALLFFIFGVFCIFGVFYLKNYFFLQPKEYHSKVDLNKESLFKLLSENIPSMYSYDGRKIVEIGPEEKNNSSTIMSELALYFKGQKDESIILHFWASWCDPCIGELPELIAFAQKNKNYKVVLISQDYDADGLKKFIQIFPEMGTDLFVGIWDKDGIMSSPLGIDKLPATIVIGSQNQPRIIYGVVNWRGM